MVAVATAPGTDEVIRRASRIAVRAHADLHVVHVSTSAHAATGEREGGELERLELLATDLGAVWQEIRASDPVVALVAYATEHQVTQLVIGSSQRSRLKEMWGGGSVVRRLARRASANHVDVHIIGRREEPKPE